MLFWQPFFYSLLPLVVFIVFLLKWLSTSPKPHKNKPPSPSKFPVVGNLHQISSFPHRSLQSLAQKYGPLMMLHFGSCPVLVVSSADAAHEIMKTHDLVFSNRPKSTIASKLLYGCKDVGFSSYEWPLGGSTEGEEGKKFKELLGELGRLLGVSNVGDYIPWLEWVNHFNGLYGRADKAAKKIDSFLESVVEDHMMNLQAGEANRGESIESERPQDFVDVLLQIQRDSTVGFPIHGDGIKALILAWPSDFHLSLFSSSFQLKHILNFLFF